MAKLASDTERAPRVRYVQAAMGLAGSLDGAVQLRADGKLSRCVAAEDKQAIDAASVLQMVGLYADKVAEIMTSERTNNDPLKEPSITDGP